MKRKVHQNNVQQQSANYTNKYKSDFICLVNDADAALFNIFTILQKNFPKIVEALNESEENDGQLFDFDYGGYFAAAPKSYNKFTDKDWNSFPITSQDAKWNFGWSIVRSFKNAFEGVSQHTTYFKTRRKARLQEFVQE